MQNMPAVILGRLGAPERLELGERHGVPADLEQQRLALLERHARLPQANVQRDDLAWRDRVARRVVVLGELGGGLGGGDGAVACAQRAAGPQVA